MNFLELLLVTCFLSITTLRLAVPIAVTADPFSDV